MTQLAETSVPHVSPVAPSTLAETGLSTHLMSELILKTLHRSTELSGTAAPAQSWDTNYNFFGAQQSVATAAPGDPGYNGGRWEVHKVSTPRGYAEALSEGDLDGNGVLDSADEIDAALASGALVDDGIVKYFVCTLNKVPANG